MSTEALMQPSTYWWPSISTGSYMPGIALDARIACASGPSVKTRFSPRVRFVATTPSRSFASSNVAPWKCSRRSFGTTWLEDKLSGFFHSCDASRAGFQCTRASWSSPSQMRSNSSGCSGSIASTAPFIAPTLVPTTSCGRKPIWCAAWIYAACTIPSAPPPPSTSAGQPADGAVEISKAILASAPIIGRWAGILYRAPGLAASEGLHLWRDLRGQVFGDGVVIEVEVLELHFL